MSNEIQLYYLRRELAAVAERIIHHEVRALIPPATCTEPELFSKMENDYAQAFRRRQMAISDEILRLEGQLELSFFGKPMDGVRQSAPVHLCGS